MPPVHFVCQSSVIWPELRLGTVPEISGDRLSELSGGITHSWVLRTYYHLARVGAPVSLGPEPRPYQINVAGVRDFGRRLARPDAFMLIPRGDAHMPMLADFVVYQNGLRPCTATCAVMPHWPQPGIRRRRPERGTRIERLVYKGRLYNLDAAFRSQEFRDSLSERNIALDLDAFNELRGVHRWNDYSDADIVIAVRNITRYDASNKPASKLVNAWIAETPALLGPEPAYRELRQGPEDYVEVVSAEDALEAIDRLRQSPAQYQAMLDIARKRQLDYSEAEITSSWIRLFSGQVVAALDAWLRRSGFTGRGRHLAGIALEAPSKRLHSLRVYYGPRILDARLPG